MRSTTWSLTARIFIAVSLCRRSEFPAREAFMAAKGGQLPIPSTHTIIQGLRGHLDTQNITQPLGEDPTLPRRQLQSGATLVKRYHIQEVIGVGGMGSVYRARDLHF